MLTDTTILVRKETRCLLSKIGRKEQTYDDIINELIKVKQRCPIDSAKSTEQERL